MDSVQLKMKMNRSDNYNNINLMTNDENMKLLEYEELKSRNISQIFS